MEKNCSTCKHSILVGMIFYQCKLSASLGAVWNNCNNWEEKEENE
jgi:hypothetical protein